MLTKYISDQRSKLNFGSSCLNCCFGGGSLVVHEFLGLHSCPMLSTAVFSCHS